MIRTLLAVNNRVSSLCGASPPVIIVDTWVNVRDYDMRRVTSREKSKSSQSYEVYKNSF